MATSEAEEIKKQETLVRFSIISYKTRLRVLISDYIHSMLNIVTQGWWKLLEFGWASDQYSIFSHKRIDQFFVLQQFEVNKCPTWPPCPPTSTVPVT